MPGGGRFGDWGKGPKFEGEAWIVHYRVRVENKTQEGRIKVWSKQGKEGARKRVLGQGERRGLRYQIINIYRPGRTPAGLWVPEGTEEEI